jgi:hypothetical protein
MLVCPKCKSEYQEGYTVCKDCQCELVEMPEASEEDSNDSRASSRSQLSRNLLVFSAIFILGIVIVLSSINLSEIEMSNIMRAHGGSMDTNKYLIYLEQSIIKYRVVGLILALLGGLGVLSATHCKQ